MRKLLVALAPVMLSGSPAQPPVQLTLSKSASTDLAVLAYVSHKLHIEQARCVTRYTLTHKGDTVAIKLEQIGPAEVAVATDSTIVFYTASDTAGEARVSFCNDTLPGVHTHILDNEWLYTPSPLDSATKLRRHAPFEVLVSLDDTGYAIQVWGLKP